MSTETSFGTSYDSLAGYAADASGSLAPSSGAMSSASSAAPAASSSASASSSSSSAASGDLLATVMKLGLTEKKAHETVVNQKVTDNIIAVLGMYKEAEVPKSHGLLMYEVSTKAATNPWLVPKLDFVVGHIKANRIATKPQLEEAFKFVQKANVTGDYTGFEEACGVGVSFSEAEIAAAVTAAIEAQKEKIVADRYHTNIGKLISSTRSLAPKNKWMDAKAVKAEAEKQLAALLGPRLPSDDVKPKKEKGKKEKGASDKGKGGKGDAAAASVSADAESEETSFLGAAAKFHKPGHNYETDGYVVTPNTDALLKKHLEATNSKVVTRFPPEPNGILHVGHAKAINFNFGYAKDQNGICYLRYDDTNPEAEDEEFFVGIRRDVEWLGWTPYKITHSSDYFDQLYEWAVKLIRENLAYICHMKGEELKGQNVKESPWRNRPIEESLSLFEDMKNGLIDEGEATLRLKHVMKDGKVDPVAYRIKFLEHARTGDKWCVYPTYDYTHCLCDSIENISHSLCTKEFQNRRPSYYWLCNAVDVYCPVQWEYSRLNLTHTVVSKRKIGRLIKAGVVKSWDDPRLFTLAALRRRGFPPEAIHDFTNKIGVSEATTVLSPLMLEHCVRDALNKSAVRVMAALDPLKLVIVDRPDEDREIEIPDIPATIVENAPTHKVPFSNVVYIDRSDFEAESVKGFRRLTPNQAVGLKYTGLVVSVKEVITGEDGEIKEIHVTSTPADKVEKKPKAFITWVSSPAGTHPVKSEVRVYKRLFKSPNPEGNPEGLLADVSEDSLTSHHGALVDVAATGKPGTVYQFERIGFFCVDPDTERLGRSVFNLTVSLREDAAKK